MNVIPVNEKHKNIGCCPKCENKPVNRVSTLAQAPMKKNPNRVDGCNVQPVGVMSEMVPLLPALLVRLNEGSVVIGMSTQAQQSCEKLHQGTPVPLKG